MPEIDISTTPTEVTVFAVIGFHLTVLAAVFALLWLGDRLGRWLIAWAHGRAIKNGHVPGATYPEKEIP